MISCQSHSDAEIRQVVSFFAQICCSGEFQELKEELMKIYAESNDENGEIRAFEDALYAILMQYEEQNPQIKELIARL